jgi:hypothetical protein
MLRPAHPHSAGMDAVVRCWKGVLHVGTVKDVNECVCSPKPLVWPSTCLQMLAYFACGAVDEADSREGPATGMRVSMW